ncbi:MAG: hypothetical protein Q9205_006671 [Flavoplaca limonia]
MPRLIDESDQTTSWKRSTLVILLIITAILLAYPSFRDYTSQSLPVLQDSNMETDFKESDSTPLPTPRIRAGFGLRMTTIRGFPSKGGFYLLEVAGPVEMDFLGLDHFQEALPSINPTEEDAFCQRMRALGASWFENETEAERTTPFKVVNGKRVGKTEVWFGWPEHGGVWVLEVEEFEGARRGIGGRLRNAQTMDERCNCIKMLGGTFFGNKEDCPLTKGLTF